MGIVVLRFYGGDGTVVLRDYAWGVIVLRSYGGDRSAQVLWRG